MKDLKLYRKYESGYKQIICSIIGRPTPTIEWLINDKYIEKDDTIFTINTSKDDKKLLTKSIYEIKNPISFENKTKITCRFHGYNSNLSTTHQKSLLIYKRKLIGLLMPKYIIFVNFFKILFNNY